MSRGNTHLRWYFLILGAFSTVWIGALGSIFVAKWNDDIVPTDRIYLLRERSCIASYHDESARERCLDIMKLERFQERSIMVANRVLACALPPLIGIGVLVYLRRRGTKGRAK